MRRAALVLLPLAAVLAILLVRMDGPSPKAAGAPANEFSSARAMQVLRALLAENVPHPVGPPANPRAPRRPEPPRGARGAPAEHRPRAVGAPATQRVRDRSGTRFRALGYETVVQRRFGCSPAA